MNDDARFFFYLSGFVGFLLFFLLGILLTKDFLIALVQSSFGCLFFAICGRWILSFILNGTIVDSLSKPLDSHSSGKLPLSTKNDPTDLTVAAMNEASTKAPHLVEAQV
jgi:hypothetical protein|tara:strand:+ start:295 stop:621 length:327 start_codon:yes stop_codon:yes gene_type:complete